MWLCISVCVIPERLMGTNQCGRQGSAVNFPKISQSQAGSQWLYIAHRWLPEEAAVFTIELTGTFVSDLKGRTGGIQAIYEHTFPRCMQPKLLLILKRTHGGQRPEMVVQCGEAHACDFCEVLHS